MNTNQEIELKKEFQLERIILFSDAVFAIIITIMVIDLKLPENIREVSAGVFQHEFMSLYVRFVGYIISFFFVAMFWTRHVKLFGYLKDYNRTLLFFNLFFLFCISLFPLAATMITGFNHLNSIQALWGYNVYIVVILLCIFSHTLLTGYLVKNRERLCFGVEMIENQLRWKVLRNNYIIVPLMFVVLVGLDYAGVKAQYLGYLIAFYGIFTGIATKHYYPKSIGDNRPVIFRMFSRRQKKSREAKLPPGE